MKKEKLSIQRFENESGTVSFRVFGYLHGERVRRNFATREEAAAEKTTLEIQAHQVAAGYRPVLTTLTESQAREAESVFARLFGKAQSLTFYVDFALENYTPPETAKRLKAGIVDYLAARKRELDQDQLSAEQIPHRPRKLQKASAEVREALRSFARRAATYFPPASQSALISVGHCDHVVHGRSIAAPPSTGFA